MSLLHVNLNHVIVLCCFLNYFQKTVCVSDESMQKCFGEGTGLVYQDVLSWLQSSNTQLQLSGALAIANFARNGEMFVKKTHYMVLLTVFESGETETAFTAL